MSGPSYERPKGAPLPPAGQTHEPGALQSRLESLLNPEGVPQPVVATEPVPEHGTWFEKKVRGVTVALLIEPFGEPVEKEPGRFVLPVRALWRIEGKGIYTPDQPLFVAKEILDRHPEDWREGAYQSLRLAIITSLES